MIGHHWIARASGISRDRLEDSERLKRLLTELPDTLGLTRVGVPVVSGRAGVVLLSESHASIHCAPNSGGLYADIFSCAPFDPGLAARMLEDAYAPDALHWRVLERGDGEPANQTNDTPRHTSGLFRVTAPDDQVADALAALGFERGEDRIKRFEPHGLSWLRRDGVRWAALHTWPERSRVSVDVFGVALDLSVRLAALGWVSVE